MKTLFEKISILFLLTAILVACKGIHEQSLPIGEETIKTRASDFEATDFYWYNGEKIPLQRLENKFYVLFSADEKDLTGEIVSASIEFTRFEDVSRFNSHLRDMSGRGVQKFINSKAAIIEGSFTNNETLSPSVLYWSPYFRTIRGHEIGITEMFFVLFKPDTKEEQLEALAEKYAVELLGADKYLPGLYMLSCTHLSKGNSLQMANAFYDSGLFEEASPNHIMTLRPQCVNEISFGSFDLWHLRNVFYPNIDVKYCNARSFVPMASSNIKVAIIDAHGVQTDHPDLYNVLPGYNAANNTVPNSVTGEHGTMMAGFIAATPNNINNSVAGIAYGVKILPINISVTSNANDVKNAFNYAVSNGADVIVFAWETEYNFTAQTAIINALNNGRSNKGCVVVMSAGNEGNSSVMYPANVDPRILVVGSVEKPGNLSDFSNTGSLLDIVAPGYLLASTTLTSSGADYAGYIIGTSFAAPQAAAVAALILSENPSLTQQQVTDIIEKGAYKLSGYSYSTYNDRPNGTFNFEVGHGLLNAHSAVFFAKPRIVGPNNLCVSSPQTFTVPDPPAALTWGCSSNLSISGSGSSISVTGVSSGLGWVSTNINGKEMQRHTVWVGPPIVSISGTSMAKAGGALTFTASLQIPTTSYSWSIYPTTGTKITHDIPYDSTCNIYFSALAANTSFTVTVVATNSCGQSAAIYNVDIGTYSGEW